MAPGAIGLCMDRLPDLGEGRGRDRQGRPVRVEATLFELQSRVAEHPRDNGTRVGYEILVTYFENAAAG